MSDRIASVWGPRTPTARDGRWPVRVDVRLDLGLTEADVEHWVPSACVLCSNGCGADIAVRDGRMVGVRGRATDVVNHGRLGPKGLHASCRAANSDRRLTRPLVRRGGELVETGWDTAMERIVERSRYLLERHGPSSHGFYGSGQMMAEEYYTWGVIAKAGIGTNHMDGNTRLCTATAAAAMKESFGSDGQPGSYTDVESCDVIALYGHNMAETQTVLWARVLDRLEGPNPPTVIAVDPRSTPVADAARRTGGVHLAPLPGTNLALLNGMVRALVAGGYVDHGYLDAHVHGYDDLVAAVEPYTPEETARICDVDVADVVRAVEVIGRAERLLSTVLQGFYQSHQATASSCAVNNIHLLRGMLGRPGCGVLQMNGQPTAQNAREAGSNGDLPGFRNWDNPAHIDQLAALWNVDRDVIPHDGPPTDALEIFRLAEAGDIGLLWIAATNPAVSLPQLPRIREILDREELFVVVQDGFLTETARYADVVLPAAMWGEREGVFTNVNRTVHHAGKAVDPPGEARPDLDIFLDYARRMDFRDRDGQPLLGWDTAEGAFEAWKECSRGRLCDYSGLSYERLSGSGGIPWPVTEATPDGCDRLYADGVFATGADVCETYGHDLSTGAGLSREEYLALGLEGRARLRGCAHTPAAEVPDDEHPFAVITGRTVYQFHTRTKTGGAGALHAAAPDAWAELSVDDARRLGVAEGDIVRIGNDRGSVEVPARVGRGRPGVVFVPFHYGYEDAASSGDRRSPGTGPGRAANELTPYDKDPVSKQPLLKAGTARVTRVRNGDGPAPAPTTAASAPARRGSVRPTRGRDDGTTWERASDVVPRRVPTPEHTPNTGPGCGARPSAAGSGG
ncbi:molybdopterin oxidoreductase family protein [Pseudonocardia alni]|uniref:molybdopterin oxidoreductase family protein n=1 Tax=Pseudonocardia alni TaxID=33907 RepID=UPI00280B5650|nr:molybdopterin oxidoreductase family protein [Pseudonocardia alni]